MTRTTTNLPFEIRRSSIQGRGAFATRDIRKGTRIVEYTGERVDQDEADRRYDDGQMHRHHTFLFALEDGMTIDGASGGNISRFINHSCDPNCAAYEEDGRIFVEAVRTIREGEELVYDYSYARTEDTTPEDEELYRCRCGATNCRGSILAPEPEAKATKKATKKASAGEAHCPTCGAPLDAAGTAATKKARKKAPHTKGPQKKGLKQKAAAKKSAKSAR